MRQRQLLAPLLIAVIAGICACGGDHGTNPTSNAGLLSGQVTEFSTQKPVAGTGLVVRSSGDQFMASTDANGMYTVTLPTGTSTPVSPLVVVCSTSFATLSKSRASERLTRA